MNKTQSHRSAVLSDEETEKDDGLSTKSGLHTSLGLKSLPNTNTSLIVSTGQLDQNTESQEVHFVESSNENG